MSVWKAVLLWCATLAPMAGQAAAADACTVAEGLGAEIASLLAGTNAERGRNGLAPLAPDPALTRAAQSFACEMVRRDRFGHGPAGALRKRIGREGCRPRLAAENIAMGHASGRRTLGQWMASSGHRRNILTPGLRRIGLGVALPRAGQGGGPRWVMVLADRC